jgi:5-methylcytosine-specific restriction enzyme subunit McrC
VEASIRLTTYESSDPIALSDQDVQYFSEEHSQRISVVRDLHSECYRLNPNQYVGVLVLPSGRRVEARPRVGVANLLYMLAVAYRMPAEFREPVSIFAPFDELVEAVVRYYADLVDDLIAGGLYRAYMDTEENLLTVRGRILFASDARRNFVLRQRTYCRFSEFTWDIPENQVLRHVATLVEGWTFRNEALRVRMRRIIGELDELTPVQFQSRDLDQFVYYRQLQRYERPHALCRLLLEGTTLSEVAGEAPFQTFLIDMNKLFESFVTQALIDRTPSAVRVNAQATVPLDMDSKVPMRPDLVVVAARSNRVLHVADCKFKRLVSEEYKNHDHYQLLAYCTALNVTSGTLIYPLHEVEVADSVQVRHSDAVIRTTTINLAGSVADLEKECDRVACELFGQAAKAHAA